MLVAKIIQLLRRSSASIREGKVSMDSAFLIHSPHIINKMARCPLTILKVVLIVLSFRLLTFCCLIFGRVANFGACFTSEHHCWAESEEKDGTVQEERWDVSFIIRYSKYKLHVSMIVIFVLYFPVLLWQF
jgi:hypothetical protein